MMILKNVPNPNYNGQRNIVPTVQVALCSCGGSTIKSRYSPYGDPDVLNIVHTCILCGDSLLIEK